MTVVHPHPHPSAMKTVQITNPQVAKKFGDRVYLVDWDDRVAGSTWAERVANGGSPEAATYQESQYNALVTGDLGEASGRLEVVRCHDLTTGELILLHDDWIS